MIAIPTFEHFSGTALLRCAIAFIFLVIVASSGLLSTLIYWEIMEKVNARLPEAERFQPLWWGPLKRTRLKEEYRRLFPEGNDLKRIYRLATIMFAAIVGLLITLGFVL